jgi:uncharacterized protein (TIGR00730 family)
MNIAVYCGSSMGTCDEFEQAAYDLGAWIAANGHRLVYGGSSVGLMGVISSAVMQAGGTVIGVEPQFFLDAGVAQHDLTELVVVQTMSQRKAKMIELSHAFIALPGGVGTLEEITEIMSRIRLKLTDGPCILLNVNGYYDSLARMLDMVAASGFMFQHERDAIHFPTTVEEAVSYLT